MSDPEFDTWYEVTHGGSTLPTDGDPSYHFATAEEAWATGDVHAAQHKDFWGYSYPIKVYRVETKTTEISRSFRPISTIPSEFLG